MKSFHNVTITVFVKEDEDRQKLESGLKSFLDVNLDEPPSVESKSAMGFNEKKIVILRLKLSKTRHIRIFTDKILRELSEDDKNMLKYQIDSRIDQNLDFYLRFDRSSVLENKLKLTESGNCYHIRMSVAAFPKKKDIAAEIVRKALAL